MTNQGPTYSPDYRSEAKHIELYAAVYAGRDALPPPNCAGCTARFQVGESMFGSSEDATKIYCATCWHGLTSKVSSELKSAQPYSGPPRTPDDYDWSKLRAEAAIRIYCELIQYPKGEIEPHTAAVSMADMLIAELRRVKP